MSLSADAETSFVQPRLAVIERPLLLDCGQSLDRLVIEYESYGQLDAAGSNAILVCHGLGGNAHAAGVRQGEDGATGWWHLAIGPGKMLDTDRYFILCSSVIGTGGSTGPGTIDPQTGKSYGMRFPVVTIADMVRAQAYLIDELGIGRLRAVAGGCFGGVQALTWGALYPGRVDSVVAITVRAATAPYSIALWRIIRHAICSDPDWRQGDYYDQPRPKLGPGLATAISLLQWMDDAVMERKYGRRRLFDVGPQYTFEPEFLVEQMLERVLSGEGSRFDPNSLVYLTRAIDYFDLAEIYEGARSTGSRAAPRHLLVSYDRDHRYPVEETRKLAGMLQAKGSRVDHRVLSSAFSHGGYQYDVSGLQPLIEDVLSSREPARQCADDRTQRGEKSPLPLC